MTKYHFKELKTEIAISVFCLLLILVRKVNFNNANSG